MNYKNWCQKVLLGVVGLGVGLSMAAYIVDPVGMWHHGMLQGFNHHKVKQSVFLDVYKPFELRYYQPEDIYIGTSRVFVGWRAEENAYNLGASSLSLPDMRDYLHYAYSQNKPKRVYIGLDLFQFSQKSMREHRNGFSRERLETLATGGLSAWGEILKTNVAMSKEVPSTVTNSFRNRQDSTPFFTRGYSVRRGEIGAVSVQEYYYNLHSYYDTYSNFTYDIDAINCLDDILREAKDNNVSVVLFFNPVSVDLLALQDICQVADIYTEVKKSVAKLHPVYDFAWLNTLTLGRDKYWLDGSHYHGSVGERLKSSINQDVDSEICKLLTAENVDDFMELEKAAYQEWVTGQQGYLEALQKVSSDKEYEPGALEEYLGF